MLGLGGPHDVLVLVVIVSALFLSAFTFAEEENATSSSEDEKKAIADSTLTAPGFFDNYFCGRIKGRLSDCGPPYYVLLLPFIYGCIVAWPCWVRLSEARIVGYNQIVRASVSTRTERRPCRAGGDHDNGTPPRELLSYVYANETYTIWKNNLRGNVSSSYSCAVYVDPYRPECCVVQGEAGVGAQVMHTVLFSLSGTAMVFFVINIFLLPGTPTIVYWTLYGSIFLIPILFTVYTYLNGSFKRCYV